MSRSRFALDVLRSARRRDLAAGLVIASVWLLFYWRLFTPVEADRVQFPSGDFTQQFFVFRSFAFDELKHGRMPLWMPCVDSGYPYQADPQSALFYPPGLLNTFMHLAAGAERFPLVALEWESALHVLLAALLMYAFLRGETRRRASALIGALVFGFGGYLAGYPVLQMAIVEAAAWLPLALWGARRAAARGDGRSIAFAAAPLALGILAGHPQTYTFSVYTVALYFAYRARREGVPWRGVLARLAAIIGVAAALGAVQLLPSFEYAGQSTRAGLSYAEAGTGFPPSDLIQFFVAGVVSHFSPLYVGLLPLALIALALGPGRKRDAAFWLGLGLVGLLLSFGGHLAAFDPAYFLAPGYRLFRDQERHALMVAAAAGVLSAYGADAALGGMSRRARAWLRGEMRWLAAGLALLIVALAVTLYLSWQGDAAAQSIPDRVAVSVMALGAALGALSLRPVRSARRWLPSAMVLVVGFDLATAGRAVNWAGPADPFPPQPVIDVIQADARAGSIFRIHNEQRLPGHAPCMSGLDEIGGITPIHVGAYDRFARTVPRDVRWQLLNVRYVVTWRGGLEDRLGRPIDAARLWQSGEGEDATYVYRLSQAHPRAWVVHEVETRTNRDAIFAALAEPEFDPRQIAYTLAPMSVDPAAGEDRVAVSTLEPNRVVVDADLASAGLLILSEVAYPGWVAVVNGIESPIVEVDGLLRGVALSAGSSHVEIAYRPAAMWVGLVLSGLGLAVWFILLALGRNRVGPFRSK